MTDESHFGINEHEWDRGLWWMVLASGAAHVVAVVLLLLIPQSFAHHPPPLVSYTVDLVAPDKIGGTNVVPGGKGRVEGPPLNVAPPPPKVEAPKPVPPKVEEAKPPPPPEKPAPKEVAKPEPPKVEQKPEVKEPPKVEPKKEEAVLAEKVKKVEPPPAPTAVKPAPSPKVVTKAEPVKPPPPKVDAEAAKKAAADAAKKAAEESAARQRDERILAAVKRAEQQAGTRGGGTGQKPAEQPGGPISVGPGQGAGGKVMGLEYMLYYNALINRLKQSWAWPGTDRSLEAVVHFSITDTGDVVDIRITRSSGDPTYDASVERAVKGVNPLPPPPDGYRKEFADVEITFSPEALQM